MVFRTLLGAVALAFLITFALTRDAHANVFRNLEKDLRVSLKHAEKNVGDQMIEFDQVKAVATPSQARQIDAIEQSLRQQEETIATASTQLTQLADQATAVQTQKEVLSAGFYTSLAANLIALAGLFLRNRVDKLDRELKRLTIEKTNHELAEFRARTRQAT